MESSHVPRTKHGAGQRFFRGNPRASDAGVRQNAPRDGVNAKTLARALQKRAKAHGLAKTGEFAAGIKVGLDQAAGVPRARRVIATPESRPPVPGNRRLLASRRLDVAVEQHAAWSADDDSDC
jgi:hypothetical protein